MAAQLYPGEQVSGAGPLTLTGAVALGGGGDASFLAWGEPGLMVAPLQVDLLEWLCALGLPQYHKQLVSSGYDTMGLVADLTWEELQEIGVNKLGEGPLEAPWPPLPPLPSSIPETREKGAVYPKQMAQPVQTQLTSDPISPSRASEEAYARGEATHRTSAGPAARRSPRRRRAQDDQGARADGHRRPGERGRPSRGRPSPQNLPGQ